MPPFREHLLLDIRDQSDPLTRLCEVLAANIGPLVVVVMQKDHHLLAGMASRGWRWNLTSDSHAAWIIEIFDQ